MKISIFLLFLSIVTSCANSITNSEQIVAKLKIEGENYYNYLIENKKYEKVLDKIESGDDVLIRNSYLFKPWVDASTSLSLTYALSRSLTKNPEAVFSVVPEHFSLKDICTIPYIEVPINIELEHIDKSIQALDNILKDKTDSKVSECMFFYKKIRKKITNSVTN